MALSTGIILCAIWGFEVPEFLTDQVGSAMPVDSLEAFDDYGFDRLSDDDEMLRETWLPEVAVEGTAVQVLTTQLLDTISAEEWYHYAQALRLTANPGNLLPLDPDYNLQILRPKGQVFGVLSACLAQQVVFREITWDSTLSVITPNCQREEPVLLLLDEAAYLELPNATNSILALASQQPCVIVFFGAQLPWQLSILPVPVIFLPDASPIAQAMAAQALFGSVAVPLGSGGELAATRLGHAPPEIEGIDRTQLASIDSYVDQAIRRKAIPGCQVWVAKGGRIVYDKTFGYHTYDKVRAVEPQDVYDLASLTKAAATTLGIMKMYDQGQLKLEERLRDYLPTYNRTGLQYLRVQHLLAHQTGLQANLPIAHWLRQQDLFKTQKDENHLTPIGQGLYLKNGVREELLAELKTVSTPRKSFYRYSDVNFILLQQLLEYQTGQPLDHYVNKTIYRPLGLHRLQFLPGLQLPQQEIVPTEMDRKWRRQLVQGEVHDESATLLGGVAGHAGLFSNARDLAVVFQMLLNKGTYGGHTFFAPATVDEFTARNGYNYRAFGFDRLAGHSKSLQKYGASPNTFGHTGFTGTCVWADPDNDLVFIFLSNRIYPDKHNDKLLKLGLRERIQKIIYQSLNTSKEEV